LGQRFQNESIQAKALAVEPEKINCFNKDSSG